MTNLSENPKHTRNVDDTPNLSQFLSEMSQVPEATADVTSSKSTQHPTTMTRNIDDTPNLSEFMSEMTEIPEPTAEVSPQPASAPVKSA